jgi:vesicle coat complex subunit
VIVLFSLWLASLVGCYQPSASPSPQVTVETLLRLLHDPDAVIRRTAAEALGKIGNQQTVSSLVLALDDPASIVRESSAHSLSQLGPLDTAARERIAGLLVDPVPTVRHAAAQTLAALDLPKTLWPMAMSQLVHEDPDVRRAVIQALEGVESPEALKALANSMQDPDRRVRRAAVVALAESGVPNVSAQLRERLTADSSSEVRAESAYRLQFFSVDETEERLQFVASHDKSIQVRRWTEQTLRELRGAHGSGSMPRPIPPAVPGLSHRYP